jgi:hypothetical protein
MVVGCVTDYDAVQARERYLRWVGWGAMLFSGEASAEYI